MVGLYLGPVVTFSPFQKMEIDLEKAQKMKGRIITINQTGQHIFYRNIFKQFKNF